MRRVIAIVSAAVAVAAVVAAPTSSSARPALPGAYTRTSETFIDHHAFANLKGPQSLAVNHRGDIYATATGSAGVEFVAHPRGGSWRVSRLRGVAVNQAFVTGTSVQRTLYLVATGCSGVYAVPIAPKAKTAPRITSSDLILSESTCAPEDLYVFPQAAGGPGGEIALLVQDRTASGSPIALEIGTVADGLREYPLTAPSDRQAPSDYQLAVDPKTANAYIAADTVGFGTDSTNSYVYEWTYDATSQTLSDPGQVGTARPSPSVFVGSVAAQGDRAAIVVTRLSKTSVALRSKGGEWSGFVRVPGSKPELSLPQVAFDPGSHKIWALSSRLKPRTPGEFTRGKTTVEANHYTRSGGWSKPTVVAKVARARKAAFAKVPHVLLAVRPGGAIAYAYRVVQMFHVKGTG